LNDGYKDAAVEKNGKHEPAGPFRGGKYSVYEGGTRTPFITSWPGTIKAAESDQMVCTIDLAASLCALTGVEPKPGNCIDSQDVLGALLGKADAKGRASLVQQDNGSSGSLGYRKGQWKLVRLSKPNRRSKQPATENWQLFNLAADPSEKNDLSNEKPELIQTLIAELSGFESIQSEAADD
jgi:arylsulfatase A